jgi:DNA-binding NtrC family response regulator
MMNKARILVVDDEKNAREGLAIALTSPEIEVVVAADGQEAFEKLNAWPPDLIITDIRMPRMDGMELLEKSIKCLPGTEMIILTGHGTIETAVQALSKGAYYYLTKPVNLDELDALVSRVLEKRRLTQENESLKKRLKEKYGMEGIIGRSPAMIKVMEIVRQVAPTRASVLITGESGTGKELIADAIHFNSPQRNRPLVVANCSAFAESLLESELFGHERGAFTGAIRQKTGRFEQADGGTIFLDEIGEISLQIQVKLLRVLQERQFERVGGIRPVKVDVRLIAATNRDLGQMVEEKSFRDDLYFRLKVVSINLPTLRERREDIPLLAEHFMQQFCRENNKPAMVISHEAMRLLSNYHWPGNVRELRNVMEAVVVLTNRKRINPENLPDELGHTDSTPSISIPKGTPMAQVEKIMILDTLEEMGGNRSRTADVLGIGRRTLIRKLKEYGVNPSGDSDEPEG